MQPKTTKDRLMAYPKEVLVDYLLEDYLPIYQIDFRKLELRKLQARSKKLMEEWGQLEAQLNQLNLKTSTGRAQYWQLHGRIDQIMDEVDRLNRKASALLGIGGSNAAA